VAGEYVYEWPSSERLDDSRTRDALILKLIAKRRDMPFPAWTEVWVSPLDSKYSGWGKHDGRIVRKYTDVHEATRNVEKHCEISVFVEALPRIVAKCRQSLSKPDSTSTKDGVLAGLLLLIFRCAFRIGRKRPSRAAGSPRGILYVTKDHVRVDDTLVEISFRGKWGKENECIFRDSQLSLLLRKLLDETRDCSFVFADEGASTSISYHDVLHFVKSFAPSPAAARYFTPKALRIVFVHTRLFKAISPWIADTTVSTAARTKRLAAAISKNAKLAFHSVSVHKKSYLNPRIREWLEAGDKKTLALFSARDASPVEIYRRLLERACSRRSRNYDETTPDGEETRSLSSSP